MPISDDRDLMGKSHWASLWVDQVNCWRPPTEMTDWIPMRREAGRGYRQNRGVRERVITSFLAKMPLPPARAEPAGTVPEVAYRGRVIAHYYVTLRLFGIQEGEYGATTASRMGRQMRGPRFPSGPRGLPVVDFVDRLNPVTSDPAEESRTRYGCSVRLSTSQVASQDELRETKATRTWPTVRIQRPVCGRAPLGRLTS